jgi:hypothetical protein
MLPFTIGIVTFLGWVNAGGKVKRFCMHVLNNEWAGNEAEI